MKNSPLFIGLAAAILIAACEKPKTHQETIYFPDLKPPLGVQVEVVSDLGHHPLSGPTKITIAAAVTPSMDRADVDRILETFYSQADARLKFNDKKADEIVVRVYDSAEKAKAGGDNWLGQATRTSPTDKPAYDNRQTPPLLRLAKEALGKQPQFAAALQPKLLADAQKGELEVTVPAVSDDGDGQYVKEINYVRALSDFMSFTQTLFDKVEPLKKLTFVGIHHEQEITRIWLTREQYDTMGIGQIEETMGAFQGKFMAAMMSQRVNEKALQTKIAKERERLYRESLSKLPASQVQVKL